MKIINGLVFKEDFCFHKEDLYVENGFFAANTNDEIILDANGGYVLPGFIDIHLHGNSGFDFSKGEEEGLDHIADYLAGHGITSFAIASMTQPYETLKIAYKNAAQFKNSARKDTAQLLGINMEGPFFSSEKKGAQSEKDLQLPDIEMVKSLNEVANGLIRIACVAPELPKAMDFIQAVSQFCTVSVAHTAANYDVAKEAFEKGATQVTHLYNGMLPLLHRQPGVIGAAIENSNVKAELICDGIHVHESAVRAAFRMFGSERIILISDSLCVCGGEKKQYEFGGHLISVKNGAAVLEDGITFAGSTTDLFSCVKKAISFGIQPEDAIRAATWNPAEAVGAIKAVGSIANGKHADFLICDKDFSLKATYIGGNLVKKW
ncbi:N-acetylglucosamine-6-phosphate deacetylase [Anaerovorax sp. IOR16]|uniref:N-acetylglucosamine-6-phosphate deacetylase n=1 Tax=Anaerovorax sp. IOR16 TaxID=2773458 RepID=UPI0019D2FC8B|nr:N-acetylglucosamine-6-phosphate deacetylase [Anaerovorax sp. IOR16]